MAKIHSFDERLAFSQSFENAGWWIDVYRTADAMRVTWTPTAPTLVQPEPPPTAFLNDLEGLPLFEFGARP